MLALFWGLAFPFHARRYKLANKVKYVHLTCVVMGIFVPFVPVIAAMSQYAHGKSPAEAAKGGLGFGVTRLPSLLCNGIDRNTTFYSLILLIIIIIMVGMTILVLVFWIIHKVSYRSYNLTISLTT